MKHFLHIRIFDLLVLLHNSTAKPTRKRHSKARLHDFLGSSTSTSSNALFSCKRMRSAENSYLKFLWVALQGTPSSSAGWMVESSSKTRLENARIEPNQTVHPEALYKPLLIFHFFNHKSLGKQKFRKISSTDFTSIPCWVADDGGAVGGCGGQAIEKLSHTLSEFPLIDKSIWPVNTNIFRWETPSCVRKENSW